MTDNNIKVFTRFRPLNKVELSMNSKKVINIKQSQTVFVQNENKAELNFNFDYVFPETSTQEEVYEIVGKPLIDEILKGYNATVFAYGQTSSGKTMTMSGYSHLVDNPELLSKDNLVLWNKPEDMGIVPRMIKDIFSTIKTKKDYQFSIQISYIEIYLEKIRDLLSPLKENLEIRESRYKGIWIEDVTETFVSSFEDAVRVMRKGELNRTVAATAMNAHSSRSHSVLIIILNQTNIKTDAKTTSKMVFVDLAGSEKIEKTKAEGLILKQAITTNKSLLNLGQVIRALVEKKVYVPYRDSKLTRLLTESLGGNSKTHLITTCSMAQYNIEETISTLRFGSITQQIKNKPIVNLEKNIEEYKRLLLQANEKIATQQLIITALQKDLNYLVGLCETHKINVDVFKRTLSERNTDENILDNFQKINDAQLALACEEINNKSSLIEDLQASISSVKDEIEKNKDLMEILRDDLEQRKQDLDNKTNEVIEFKSRNEDIQRMYDTLSKQVIENERMFRETLRDEENKNREISDDNTVLKEKIKSLTDDNFTLRDDNLSNKVSVENDTSKDLENKIRDLYHKEEELTRELNGKIRHVQVLEQSLNSEKEKLRDLASENKKKTVDLEKRIKDLESQNRILKNQTPPQNILIPMRY